MWSTLSSAAVPAGDRFEWFADVVAQALAPTALSCAAPAQFQAEAAVLDLGPVQLSTFSYPALRSRRPPALVRQSDPERYELALVTGSPMWISQGRNDSGLVLDDLVLWDTSHPFEAGAPVEGSRVRAVILQIPKVALPLRADRADRLLARRISADQGMGAIMAQFIGTLAAHGADCDPADRVRLGRAALDLAAGCLAPYVDACDELPAETRTQVLLERVSSFIDHNLGDPELTPQLVAAHHHISLRRLYQLFQGQPESVAATIRSRRLARCRADLTRPELRTHPVQAIAARWGFANAAVFSRAFRDAYGLTPSELRHRAAREDGGGCTDRQEALHAVHSSKIRSVLGSDVEGRAAVPPPGVEGETT
ncbi:AraC-like ligand-binding domain-containing protein [Kitasatospora mediocidica]|uniref:AraC-like ligand-binding domain-containing protein n=1 Tax=Kitasatospora mediocidica TaxID=58352 RepID=UPI0007C8456C|nr:helix-turn-helix domain-containing protein [Kitasatospora mediocidica]